jgi:hypothetical protein
MNYWLALAILIGLMTLIAMGPIGVALMRATL